MGKHPAWKRVEERVARYLSTRRTPLSGRSSQHGTSSDTLHRDLYVEVKHGRQAEMGWEAVEALFETVRVRARAEGKDPVLVLHPPRIGGGVENYPTIVDLLGIPVQVPLRRVREGLERRAVVAPVPAPRSGASAPPDSPSDTPG